jgi:hypothetical protein
VKEDPRIRKIRQAINQDIAKLEKRAKQKRKRKKGKRKKGRRK